MKHTPKGKEIMKKHDHCEHELEFCNHCNLVSCKKCGEEWGKAEPCRLNHYAPFYPYLIDQHHHHYPTPYWTVSAYGSNQTQSLGTTVTSGLAQLGSVSTSFS